MLHRLTTSERRLFAVLVVVTIVTLFARIG